MIGNTRKIFFRAGAHKAKFIAGIRKSGEIQADGKIDREYAAAIYLLVAIYPGLERYIKFEEIQFEQIMKEQSFSSGELTLVQLAANLFFSSYEHRINVTDITSLDEVNFQIAMEAIKIRRYGMQMGDLGG